MKRNYLLNLLHSYQPTPAELSAKTRIIHFIQSNPLCFERSLTIGHITGSAWLLNQDNTHALLTHHAKLHRWLQLGGHSDGDPNTLAVALREANEESGLLDIRPVSPSIFDLDVHPIPATPKEPAHYHYDVRFLLQSHNTAPFQVSSESKQLLWVPKDPSELPTDCPSVLRMFHKWVNF